MITYLDYLELASDLKAAGWEQNRREALAAYGLVKMLDDKQFPFESHSLEQVVDFTLKALDNCRKLCEGQKMEMISATIEFPLCTLKFEREGNTGVMVTDLGNHNVLKFNMNENREAVYRNMKDIAFHAYGKRETYHSEILELMELLTKIALR